MNVGSPQAFCQTIPPIILSNILSIDAGCTHLDEGGEEKENNLLCSESGSYRQKLNRHEGYDHCGNGKHKREDECHPPFTDRLVVIHSRVPRISGDNLSLEASILRVEEKIHAHLPIDLSYGIL